MAFKVFRLYFASLVVAMYAASVCECASVKTDSTSPSVAKYTLQMNKDGKSYEEQIDIDTETETETFHVPKTSPDEEAGDIVYDFKQNLTMVRLPVLNSCFLSEGTDDVPKPAELVKLLESQSGVAITKPQTEVKLKVIGTLEDRSRLSDEMADLCATLPIYVVEEGEFDSTHMVQPTNKALDERSKRGVYRWVCSLVCRPACKRVCSGWFCRTVCNYGCSNVCRYILVSG